MKRIKLENNKELFEAGEVIRKFKFAFAGTPEKNIKEYRKAKKKVASLLTELNSKK
jgi:ribosomal protein L29